MRVTRFLFVITGIIALSGCGTVNNLLEDEESSSIPPLFPFGGVAQDIDVVVNGTGQVEDIVLRPLLVLDLPISAACDVATLPLTIPYTGYARWVSQQEYRKTHSKHLRNGQPEDNPWPTSRRCENDPFNDENYFQPFSN